MLASREESETRREQNVEPRPEGPVAKAIERQTVKIPSDVFLWGACGAIVASAALQLSGRQKASNFVGQWAPTVLLLGLYNKIVKVAGSDRIRAMPSSEEEAPMLH
jgi:hypothetical protein